MSNVLYHNPRCSKSREALSLLEKSKQKFVVKEYLKDGLNSKEIKNIKTLLKMEVREFMRTKEDIYKELKLKDASESQLIAAITVHPILLERPLYVKAKKACIGRPPENVLKI